MFGPSSGDRAFYDAFEKHAARLVEAAELLARMLEKEDDPAGIASKITDAEHAGDAITHDTLARLRKTWITPLDRADIHALVTALDDVLDLTEAVAERLVLFDIDRVPGDARVLGQILVRGCEAVERAVKLLPDLKRAPEILALCVEINRLENEADRIYRKALANLYRDVNPDGGPSRTTLDVLKWRDIYDNLETATDRCEDVANILEGVVLEYA